MLRSPNLQVSEEGQSDEEGSEVSSPAVAEPDVAAAVADAAVQHVGIPKARAPWHPSGVSIAQAIKGACPSVYIAGTLRGPQGCTSSSMSSVQPVLHACGI